MSMFQFFLYLFIGVLFRSNFILAEDISTELENPIDVPSDFLEAVKPIEDSVRSHSIAAKNGYNFYIKSVKTAIEVTSSCYKGIKPLTFFTALDETVLINQTTRSLNAKIVNPVTVATMTGGIFGNDFYELHDYDFIWQKQKCNTTHNFEARIYYYNLKYKSYEKALDESDGVAIINVPVATNGDFPNPKFFEFYKILQNIKEPGDCAKVQSAFSYTWFANFPYGSIYHTSKGQFVDEEYGKTYTATVIDLPLDPRTNYISNKQFSNTFGRMSGVSEQSLIAEGGSVSSTERHKGVCVLFIPA